MDFERIAIIWARIERVPLSRGVPALATVCAGAFALGLAVGLPSQAPAGGVAVGGVGSAPAPVTVSDRTGQAPKSPSHPSSGAQQHRSTAPAPQPGGAGTAPAPVIAAPPLPPAESQQPGYYTIPPWVGNEGVGDGPRRNPGSQPQPKHPVRAGRENYRAGPPGNDHGENSGVPADSDWHPGHHGHHNHGGG